MREIAELARRLTLPGDPCRLALREGIAASSGLHATSTERLIDLWAKGWQYKHLHAAVAQLPTGWRPIGTVAVVAPGNLCAATWSAIAEPLLAGNRVRVRPGSGDPLAPTNFKAALAWVDAEMAERIEIHEIPRGESTQWRNFLNDCQALTVLGGDAAVTAVAQLARDVGWHGHFRGHGHLVSAAIVREDGLASYARKLAHDALLADGRGCMSLRAIWLLGDLAVGHEILHKAMKSVAGRLPAGRIAPAWSAEIALEVQRHEFEGAQVTRGQDWSLVSRVDGAYLGLGGRNLLLRPLPEHPEHFHGQLSTLAVYPPRMAEVARQFQAFRMCAPGQMQAPTAWHNRDGHAPMAAFVTTDPA